MSISLTFNFLMLYSLAARQTRAAEVYVNFVNVLLVVRKDQTKNIKKLVERLKSTPLFERFI